MITDYMVPLLLLGCSLWSLRKKENTYELLVQGSREGLKLVFTLIPTLVILLTAVTMLRASGALEWISELTAPVLGFFGIPQEVALLILIRPISGSAALAVGTELMVQYGADSVIGKTVAVMLGSTETTFYTLSVYCSAAGIHKTRYALPAALLADLTGFVLAAATVRLLL